MYDTLLPFLLFWYHVFFLGWGVGYRHWWTNVKSDSDIIMISSVSDICWLALGR